MWVLRMKTKAINGGCFGVRKGHESLCHSDDMFSSVRVIPNYQSFEYHELKGNRDKLEISAAHEHDAYRYCICIDRISLA